MNTQKVAILVLVAFVTLFVVTLGMTSRSGKDDGTSSSFISSLEQIGRKRALSTEDVSTGCAGPSGFQIALSRSCEIGVPATGLLSPVRVARLRMTGGVAATATMRTPDLPEMTARLGPGSTKELSVTRKGGTLVLTCSTGVAGCLVVLEPQP